MPSFKDSCFEAAKRFVRTAVVIDDKAGYFDDRTKPDTYVPVTPPPDGLTTPLNSLPIKPEESCIRDESEGNHDFDINPVVNGFAALKIACSVQRPNFGADKEQDERLKEWALNCAEHADITIIDWRLFEDDLQLAADIIIGLLERDIEAGGRLRLICVYTMQSTPKNILKDIMKRIVEDLNLSIAENIEELACTVDEKIRIVIFNKYAAKGAGSNARIVPFRELPKTALKEFSILAEGLLSGAALHSIAAVREQAYCLLALMNKNLDGAFCAHRAFIKDADDSINFILNLIMQEISTKILCDESARNSLDTAALKNWYDGFELPRKQYPLKKEIWECIKNGGPNLNDLPKQWATAWLQETVKGKTRLKSKDGKDINYNEAKKHIENGSFEKIKECHPPSKNNPDKFAELFYKKPAEAKKACDELCRLTCSSRDESDLRKKTHDGLFLTLGSVLKVRDEDTDYMLCLQPPCDCVRLKGETVFLFLQLYNGSAKNTDFVIKLHDGTYRPLSIKDPNKKTRFKTFKFTPDKNSRRILINKLDKNYEWVAELRPEKAQTIAQKVLTNASRIGLDEFEILRKKGSQL